MVNIASLSRNISYFDFNEFERYEIALYEASHGRMSLFDIPCYDLNNEYHDDLVGISNITHSKYYNLLQELSNEIKDSQGSFDNYVEQMKKDMESL